MTTGDRLTPPDRPLTGMGSFDKSNLGRTIRDRDGAAATRQLMEVGEFSVTLAVKDSELMTSWYCQTFGFEVDRKAAFPDYGTSVTMIRAGRVRIEILHDATFESFVRPNPPQHSSRQGATQIQFFIDDLAAFIERVKSRPDIQVAWDLIDIPVLRLKHFFIRDPEGNLIQISEPY